MAYTKQTWEPGTIFTPERMNYIEEGIYEGSKSVTYNYRGTWDPSGGTYPTGANDRDFWIIVIAGALGGVAYNVGDELTYIAGAWYNRGGGPLSIAAAVQTGWNPFPAALTYASADGPIQVANTGADMSKIIGLGNRIRLEQTQALTAYWNMDSNANSQVGSFNGTETSVTHTAGKFGNAATFNGSSSKIVIADNALLKPTGPFTLGLWFKTSASGIGTLFQSISINPNWAGIFIRVLNGILQFAVGKNTGTSASDMTAISGATIVTDNSWHYVVVSYQNNYVQIYLDRKLEAAGYCVAPAYATTNYIRIGCADTTGTEDSFFSGQIDDVFFINGYALGEDAVKKQYDAQSAQGTGSITVTKYFLVHGVTPGTLTLYGGTDSTLTSGTISNIYYSPAKAPFGFPLNRNKWMIKVSDYGSRIQNSASAGVWYNLASISITVPPGEWELGFDAVIGTTASSDNYIGLHAALSTSPNGRSDGELDIRVSSWGRNGFYRGSVKKDILLPSKTVYYLVYMTEYDGTNIYGSNSDVPLVIMAKDLYL